MEQITTEEQLRKKLKISDLENIPQDKVFPLASQTKKMAPHLIESVLSHFQNFNETVSSALNHCCSITKDLIEADKNNETMLYNQIKNEQDCCFELLKSDQLTFDEKLEILNHLNVLRDYIDKLNKRSKNHKLKVQALTFLGIGGVIIAVLAGIIYCISTNSDDEDDDEDDDDE